MADISLLCTAWMINSCTEEQQRLEHGVRKQVEHACHITPVRLRAGLWIYIRQERYHHKAYLRDGGEASTRLMSSAQATLAA